MTSRQAAMMLVRLVKNQCNMVSIEEFRQLTAASPPSHSRPLWVRLDVSPDGGPEFADIAGHYVMKIGAN